MSNIAVVSPSDAYKYCLGFSYARIIFMYGYEDKDQPGYGG